MVILCFLPLVCSMVALVPLSLQLLACRPVMELILPATTTHWVSGFSASGILNHVWIPYTDLFITVWAVWNLFFLIGSLRLNLVYIGIFFTVQLSFTLVAGSYFAAADGHIDGSIALRKAGGVFAFLSGLLGYYTVGNLMCQEALNFRFPMGDTSHFFGSNDQGSPVKADKSS